MDDDADFTLKLLNQLSGPAKKMAADVRTLERELESLDRAAAAMRGPEALKRFDLSRQIRQAKQAQAFQKQITASIVKEQLARSQARDAQILQRNKEVRAAQDAMRSAIVTEQKKRQQIRKQERDLLQNIRNARLTRKNEFFDTAGAFVMRSALIGVSVAAAAAAAAIAVLAFKFTSATHESIKFRQTSLLALEKLTGSSVTAAGQFDSTRREAERLGQDVFETQKAFQKLLAAQFEVGKAREILRMSADLRAIGASAEEVHRALLAMTQIKSKGRLMAEEMLQLQEAGISAELVYKVLGERLGKTTAELRKMQEQGQIDSVMGIEAIIDAVKLKTGVETTGEAGADFASKTLEGQEAQLKGFFQNLFIDIGAAVEPVFVPIVGKLIELLKSIAKNPDVQALGTFLLNRFELFGMWVEANWPTIMGVINTGISLVASLIRGAVDTIDFFAQNWETVRTVLIGVGIVLGILAAGAALVLAPFLLFTAAVLAVVGAVAFVIGWVASHVGDWFSAGADLIGGLIDGITSKFTGAVDAVKQFGNDVLAAFKRVTGIASPSRVFEDYGQFTVEGYVRGIVANDNAAMAATRDLGMAANDGIQSELGQAPTLLRSQTTAAAATADLDALRGDDISTVRIGNVSVQVTVNGDADAEQVKQGVESGTLDALERFFGEAS